VAGPGPHPGALDGGDPVSTMEWRAREEQMRRRADELVTKGAAMMDLVYPEWRDVVDPSRLDMASECGCVWGQIGGSYIDVMAWLDPESVTEYGDVSDNSHRYVSDSTGPGTRWMAEHGFVLVEENTSLTNYDALTMRWQTELGME